MIYSLQISLSSPAKNPVLSVCEDKGRAPGSWRPTAGGLEGRFLSPEPHHCVFKRAGPHFCV
jgi:hypothetical protein